MEHAALVLGRRTLDMHLGTQPLPAEQHVRKSRVLELGHTSLLIEVKRNVAHVRLDVSKREREVVVLLVADGTVGRKLDIVVRLDLDDVREEVLALEREVLDDEIELVVGVLDARDGDVANLLDDRGEDNAADVLPK
jgi:hypothetical protein